MKSKKIYKIYGLAAGVIASVFIVEGSANKADVDTYSFMYGQADYECTDTCWKAGDGANCDPRDSYNNPPPSASSCSGHTTTVPHGNPKPTVGCSGMYVKQLVAQSPDDVIDSKDGADAILNPWFCYKWEQAQCVWTLQSADPEGDDSYRCLKATPEEFSNGTRQRGAGDSC